MERHEISLLEEELVQLTAKSSKVIPGDSLALLCSVAGQSLFLISFDSEDNLELLKIGPCLPECDKNDLMHVIGSTFGRVIRSEVKGDFFRLRVQLDVRKPLRRGIFISADKKKK
ncbi:hypothetical protein Gotri_026231, partial [Gossypium trilobum]|nr:hypothetical protein [Gossypium trilobum]